MLEESTLRASIYLTKYLQQNIPDLNKFMSAKGFTSFNGYNNYLITDDFKTNYAKVMGHKCITVDKRIEIYNDTKNIRKEKYRSNTDGEMLDLYHLLTEVRDDAIKDLKRRGVKL